jgi:hypothetical protein
MYIFVAGMEGPFGGGMENMGRFGSGMNMGRINGKICVFSSSCLTFAGCGLPSDLYRLQTIFE